MARTTINIDDALFERLKLLAEQDNRSAPNLIETIVLRYLQETQFVDALEMAAQKVFRKTTTPFEYRTIHKKLSELVYPQLRREPHFGTNIKQLRNDTPETYCYRIGHCRVFYAIDEKAKNVILTALRHRKDAYR